MGARGTPGALRLHPTDNVAVAVVDLGRGELVELPDAAVTTIEPVRAGHKVAVAPIALGGPVRKYGETIGIASAAIPIGAHVHVHSVVSGRLPAPSC